jgi:hypothetical protein
MEEAYQVPAKVGCMLMGWHPVRDPEVGNYPTFHLAPPAEDTCDHTFSSIPNGSMTSRVNW